MHAQYRKLMVVVAIQSEGRHLHENGTNFDRYKSFSYRSQNQDKPRKPIIDIWVSALHYIIQEWKYKDLCWENG